MTLYFAALILTFVLNLLAVCRMIAFRVQRKLPFLITFLIFQLAQSIAVFVMTGSVQSRVYQAVYEITEPINWILYILIVREMYGRAFADYPGISTFARWASYASGAAAVLLCIAVAVVLPTQRWPHARIFVYIESWERFVFCALAAFILIMIFLLSKYPIKLDFNVAASIIIFTIYFAGSFLFLQIGAPATASALRFQTNGLFAVSGVCFAAWGVFLRADARSSRVQVRVNLEPFEEQRLLDQLALINNMLVKSARH